MMEIYFDNVLINEDYYTSLSTSFALFNDTFYLGSTASNTYNLSVAKEAVSKQPNIVTVKDNGVLIATLVVDKIEENDFEYKYTLTDKMVNLEFEYDASQIFTNGSATLLKIAQDICNKVGITLATTNFRGYNKKVSWYDNTRTAREYIGYIAELNGGYAQIGKDGKLYFLKQKTSPVKTINFDECEDFKIGEKHKITRVVYELGALKYEYGDETGNTLYLNSDNVYITEENEVKEIFNEINGFEFYSFSTSNCPIDYEIMAGQVIAFTDGTNNYPTIAGYNLTYNGGWYGGYELNVATKKQEETQVVGTDKKIKNLSIKVDRDKNEIITKIESVESQVTDITTTQATLEGTEIRIDDGAEEPIIKLEVDGHSIQEGTPTPEAPVEIQSVGDDVNLFDKSVGFTYGYISSTGGLVEDRSNKNVLFNEYVSVEGNKDYTFGCNVNLARIGISEFKDDKTFIKRTETASQNHLTITTDVDTKYLRIVLIYANEETTQEIVDTLDLKLQKGTVATPYSEYGKGSVGIKQVGKNLFSGFVKGIALNSTTGAETTGTTKATTNYIQVDFNENPNYYLSGLTDSLYSYVAAYNSNKEFLGRTGGLSYKNLLLTSSSFTGGTAQGTGDIAYLRITTYENPGYTTGSIDDIDNLKVQLEEETETIEYEPYKCNNYVIPLSQPLRSLPNGVKDTIEEDGIHRRVGSVVLDGSDDEKIGETVSQPNNTNLKSYAFNNIENFKKGSMLLSDYFKYLGTSAKISTYNEFGCWVNTGGAQFGVITNKLTVEEFKIWLQENPIQVDYELAEEVIEPFDEEQQAVIDSIKTMLGTQYFTCDANMRITYVRNNCLSNTYATVMKLNSEVTQTKDTILSTVSKTLQAYDTTEEVNSKIEQKADSITSIVSQTYATKGEYEEEMNVQNQKISKVTQTVDELNSKIQDIADITTFGESMYAKVELDSINQSEPIQIIVKPTVENISYLYPHENLFPSDDLFLKDRKIRFVNKTNDAYIDYILPDDLLIASDGTYDEFYLGYEEQVCQITKRCQYNADGTVSKLDQEQIISYDYPKIELKDGDYTIELVGYTNAYLSIRLMAQNIYTTQFATKAEVNSEILQKADEIDISVDKKLSNYSTTTQMNSAINVKANEITSNVSTTYATKGELNTAKSEIKQTTDSISSTVSKKVGNNEIISKINQSAETVGISADKIELSANDVLNLLAGNTINLSSKNIVISSDALTIKKDGTMILKGTASATDIFRVEKTSDSSVFSYIQPIGAGYVNGSSDKSVYIFVGDSSSSVDITDANGNTYIAGKGIRTPSVTQTSVEKDKKNFEALNNGLDIIKNTDIYKYNLKSQKDTDKKHIGFVIGDNYNYSKEITSENNDGVDTYSMISVAYKAIQELAEENRELKARIEALEKGENNEKN